MDLAILFGLLLLGGLLVPGGTASRRAMAGMAAYVLGWSSLRVGLLGVEPLGALSDAVAVAEPSGFLAVNLGLLLLGPIALLAGALPGWRRQTGEGRVRAAFAAIVGIVVLAAEWPGFFFLRPAPPVLLAGAIAGAGLTLFYAARALDLAARVHRADRRYPGAADVPRTPDGWRRRDGFLSLGLGVAITAALLGAGPMVVGSAAFLGAVALDQLGMRLSGRRRVPVVSLAGVVVLAVAWWAAGPLETAWEITLTGLLLLALWVVAGLWPWHRWSVPALGAPLAAAVVAQLAVQHFPSGTLFWQPLIFPVAVLSCWWAVATGRPALFLGGAALAAVATGERAALGGAALLLVAGAVLWLETARGAPERDHPAPWARQVASALSWGGLALALPPMLRAEVVYSLLLIGAAALGVVTPGSTLQERSPIRHQF